MKLYARIVPLALGCGLVGWVSVPIHQSKVIATVPIAALSRFEFDLISALKPAKSMSRRVVVVGFDTQTERSLGSAWPPSRGTLARAIANIRDDGADRIGVDILLEGASEIPGADKELDEVLRHSPGVILAARVDRDPIAAGKSTALIAPYYNDQGIDFEARARLGVTEVTLDEDGLCRRLPQGLLVAGVWYPSFSENLSGQVSRGETCAMSFRALNELVGPDLAQVAQKKFPAGLFKNAIVLIGITGQQQAKEQNDLVPMGSHRFSAVALGAANRKQIPGVYAQALFVHSLMARDTISMASPFEMLLVGLVVGFGGAAASTRRHAGWVLAGICLVSVFGALVAFFGLSTFIPMSGVLAMAVAGTLATGWNDRNRIRKAWGQYLSPGMLSELEREDAFVTPRSVEASVMFLDIRGFTASSQSLEPVAALEHLNALNQQIVPIIHQHRGIVDKFLGDGLMAVFGVPARLGGTAADAVAAARAIQQLGLESKIACGIATGPCAVGHLKGPGRQEFTVVGTTVNRAARLQSELREGGILIDEATARAGLHQDGPFELKTLKGFAEPVACLELRS